MFWNNVDMCAVVEQALVVGKIVVVRLEAEVFLESRHIPRKEHPKLGQEEVEKKNPRMEIGKKGGLGIEAEARRQKKYCLVE